MDHNKKKIRSYKRFKYSEKDLENALLAVKEGMTISKASGIYQIPKSTLHNKITEKVPNVRKMGPKSVLTPEEEHRLEKWILTKAEHGFPMHHDEVKDAVQRVLKERPRDNPFTDNRPGTKWLELFLKRHPKIRLKNTEINLKARAAASEEGLRQWFQETTEFLKDNYAIDVLSRPRSMFNGDEMGVQTCPKTGLVLGLKRDKIFDEILPELEKEFITVLSTFSASGEAVPPMVVYPYKRIPPHIAESVPNGWSIGKSESGLIMPSTFFEYMAKVFTPWCLNNEVEFPVVLFIDGHKSRLSLEVCEFCTERNIILYCLPPNSTKIMQPCYFPIFKPLETCWKQTVDEYKARTKKAVIRSTFAPLFKTAYDRVFNKEAIENGFKACGLYPFNENAVDYHRCVSEGRVDVPHESRKASISTNDFAAAKKVVEHVIGCSRSKMYSNMRNSNGDSTDSLYTFWKICTDHVESVRDQIGRDRVPEVIVKDDLSSDVAFTFVDADSQHSCDSFEF